MPWRPPLFIFFLIIVYQAFGQEGHSAVDEKLLLDRWKTATSVDEKLRAYEDLVHFYDEHKYQQSVIQELSTQTLEWAESTYDPGVIRRAQITYFLNTPKNYADPKLPERIKRVCAMAEETGDRAAMFEACYASAYASAQGMLVRPSFRDLALSNARNARNDAIELADPIRRIHADLLLGRILSVDGQFKKAYEYLLEAKKLIAVQSDEVKPQLKFELNEQLYGFMRERRNWSDAGFYKKERIKHLQAQEPVDSLKLMWEYWDLYLLSERSGKYLQKDLDYKKLLKFAKRHKLENLKESTLALYRGYLINTDRLEQLKTFYEKEYPAELDSIRKLRPVLYCMIKGYLCEADNDLDSAFFHYDRAENILTSGQENNPVMAATQFNMLGRVHLRHGKQEDAMRYFEQAYDLARYAEDYERKMEAAAQIEALSKKMGDFERAYLYAIRRGEMERELNNMDQQQAIMRLAFQTEEELEEISAQKAYKAKKAKHAVQNWAIAAGLVILVVFMLLLSRMQVAEWVIEMMSFFVVLFIFEFVILTLDHELHYATEGAPLPMFLAKVALLSFLFPLHHVIEKSVLGYMKRRKLLKDPNQSIPASLKRGIKKSLGVLWPWLDPDRKNEH